MARDAGSKLGVISAEYALSMADDAACCQPLVRSRGSPNWRGSLGAGAASCHGGTGNPMLLRKSLTCTKHWRLGKLGCVAVRSWAASSYRAGVLLWMVRAVSCHEAKRCRGVVQGAAEAESSMPEGKLCSLGAWF